MESSCDVTFSDMGQGACQCFVFVPMRRHHALWAVHVYDSALPMLKRGRFRESACQATECYIKFDESIMNGTLA